MAVGAGTSSEIGFRVARIRNRLRARRAAEPDLGSAVARLRADGVAGDPGVRPVFVLGAGWRTGSTLLQRMVNETGELVVWGEPYSEGAVVQRLGESLLFLDPVSGRSHSRTLPDTDDVPGSDTWTANLTPPTAHLVAAQRAMLDRLFGFPAQLHGAARWGVKEVVWGRDEIDLLTLLYPDASFVLLVRDPIAQWRSYRPATRRPWFLRWPDRPIGSASDFGRMWRRLVDDFVAAARDMPEQVRLVRYEDVGDAATLDSLGEFLDLDLSVGRPPAVGSSTARRFYSSSIPVREERVITRLTAKTACLLGYEAPARMAGRAAEASNPSFAPAGSS